ncbi:MAG: DNA polymerase IV [Calditrichaeota bacterium]|nr:MAG: DNA polymerase IV [Calditrichota bacterium]
MKPRTILHIDADAFFASVEQGFAPPLRGKPVIVGGTAEQRGVVHTASYEARRAGVRTGMPLNHAKRLVPDAVFLKGRFEHYKAVSLKLQEIYYRFTPVVEFTSLDDAYLDLTGTLKLHHLPPEGIARRIQEEVYRSVQISVSCGIGTSKLIARIASGVNKPSGITIVAPGKEEEFLHPLPVESLPGIGPMARERLHQLGIFTVGQLAALPKLVLTQLFGANGCKFWELAHAIDSSEVKPKMIPKQLSRETGFEEDVSDMELVREVLHYLAERIGKKLRQEGWVGQTVTIKVEYSDNKRYIKARSLPEMTDSTETIYHMVNTLLSETPFRRLRVRRVGLVVSKIERKHWQGELFNERSRQEALQAAIDEIRHRFGFTSIMPASLVNLKNHYRIEKSGYVLHAPALTQ